MAIHGKLGAMTSNRGAAITQTPNFVFKSRKVPPVKTRIHLYREAVLGLKGPPPVNIFRQLRLEKNLTLKNLTDSTGLSKQAMIRTEQGVYDAPPMALMEYWLNKGQLHNTLTESYADFQVATRTQHHKLFGEVNVKNLPDHVHPQEWLRRNWTYPPVGEPGDRIGTLNKTEMAKLLCINQAVVDYFENHVVKQQTVPFPISYALRDNGYSVAFLEELDDAYSRHRKWVLANA